MNISSSKSPYLLQIERSNRPKATYGNRFRIELKSEKAESQTTETAEEEEEMKEVGGEDSFDLPSEEESSDLPCYSITDAEAEYFLDKYGEKYNEENRFKLFAELASKNIISKDDAEIASRKNSIGIIRGGLPPEFEKKMIAKYGYCNCKIDVIWQNAVYGDSYDRYKEQSNDTPINTWQDYVQDNYNYYKYIRDTDDVLFDIHGNAFTSEYQKSFDDYCEKTLKVQNVLAQIFGEVSL